VHLIRKGGYFSCPQGWFESWPDKWILRGIVDAFFAQLVPHGSTISCVFLSAGRCPPSCGRVCVSVCACVKHLTRCKTSNYRFSRNFSTGRSRFSEFHLTKLFAVSWAYHWRRSVTYLHSCDHLLFRVCFHFTSFSCFVFENGIRPSHKPASRISINLRQPIGFPGASWRNFLSMAMVASQCFSGPFTDPFLSGVMEVLLQVRCAPQHNSEWQFWASVYHCVCVGSTPVSKGFTNWSVFQF